MTGEVCYLGLGSNLGDSARIVQDAVRHLAVLPGIRSVVCSSLYRTSPWGIREQPDFVNAVARVETVLGPLQLLTCLQHLEQRLGRTRRMRWGPREIDLDVLLYGNQEIHHRGLIVPHRHLLERAFVLVPLREVWSAGLLPGGLTVDQAISLLDGQQEIVRLDEGLTEVVVR